MCFSPTASFLTAGLTGTIGTIALARSGGPRTWPLAAVPLFFAVQQTIEGLLWLELPSNPAGALAKALPLMFLLFAEVLWPIYVPLALLLVEPSRQRRHLMLLCLGAGLSVGGYLLWWILTRTHGASIVADHIVYYTEDKHSGPLGFAYLAATGFPGILSSRRTILALGSTILIGSVIAHIFYWEAFVSVWCFFAAAASVMILYHFEQSRRQRPLPIAGSHA